MILHFLFSLNLNYTLHVKLKKLDVTATYKLLWFQGSSPKNVDLLYEHSYKKFKNVKLLMMDIWKQKMLELLRSGTFSLSPQILPNEYFQPKDTYGNI